MVLRFFERLFGKALKLQKKMNAGNVSRRLQKTAGACFIMRRCGREKKDDELCTGARRTASVCKTGAILCNVRKKYWMLKITTI